MDPVIVMVGRANEGVSDIEVMPDIPADELADAIAAAFGWNGAYDIQINGKILGRRQSMAEVDAWDGSELTMVPSNRPRHGIGQQESGNKNKYLHALTQSSQETTPVNSQNLSGKVGGKNDRVSKGELNNSKSTPVTSEPYHTLLSRSVPAKADNLIKQPENTEPEL